jgi:hypothetical protein
MVNGTSFTLAAGERMSAAGLGVNDIGLAFGGLWIRAGQPEEPDRVILLPALLRVLPGGRAQVTGRAREFSGSRRRAGTAETGGQRHPLFPESGLPPQQQKPYD